MPFQGLALAQALAVDRVEKRLYRQGQALCRLFDVEGNVVFDHGHDLIKDAALQGR